MRKISFFLFLATVMLLSFCTSSRKAQSTSSNMAKVNYTDHVKPLVVNNCSPCHIPTKGNKKPLDTYETVKTNIDDIIARIQKDPSEKGFMPFKHPKMSDSTIQVFIKWKAEGFIE